MMHLFKAPTFATVADNPAIAGAALKDKVAVRIETALKGFVEAVQQSGSSLSALEAISDDVTELPEAERSYDMWREACIQHAVHPFVSVRAIKANLMADIHDRLVADPTGTKPFPKNGTWWNVIIPPVKGGKQAAKGKLGGKGFIQIPKKGKYGNEPTATQHLVRAMQQAVHTNMYATMHLLATKHTRMRFQSAVKAEERARNIHLSLTRLDRGTARLEIEDLKAILLKRTKDITNGISFARESLSMMREDGETLANFSGRVNDLRLKMG